MSRSFTAWPTSALHSHPPAAAVTLAEFLIHRPPRRRPGGPDANLATHAGLRCRGLDGVRTHRLDSARGLKFYTTGCGLRVPKVAAVLTARTIDCLHFGCGRAS